MGGPRAQDDDALQRGLPGPHHALRVERDLEPPGHQARDPPHDRSRADGGARPVGGIQPAPARLPRVRRSRHRRREGDPAAVGDLLRCSGGEHRLQGSARGDRRARLGEKSREATKRKEEALSAVELFFRDSGGDAQPVVLAHAIGADHRMWDALAERLARRFRVVRFDSRGHGASPVPPRPYSLEEMADDACALLDRLGIEKAHWVGLSMGAMIGMAFALAYPERLGRLVLANTTSSYGPEGRGMWQARARAVEQGGLEAIEPMVMGRYFSDDFRASHPEVVAAASRRFLETPVEGYIGCCDAISELDFSADLGRIHNRTLVIAGALDAGTPPAMSQAIAERIPGARVSVIAGAAHLSAAESPEEFATLVESFLLAP